MKPKLLYYLFDGRRFDDGKRFGMYKWTDERYQILYDFEVSESDYLSL